ncbi:MAG TPA: transglycosylase SLT domain-containing protein [Solirubrobacteraceae bacterium]|nr:transglycosylase SLT domain-containing protein [Solirubrobacteraceae bacterium]
MASVQPRVDRRAALVRHRRLVLVAAGVALAIVVAVLATSGGGRPRLPLPGVGRPAKAGDPFAYVSSRRSDFEARAVAGSAHVLFTKSPGGVLATAARVAALRSLINAAAAGTGVDPNLLEALVFVESAGRSNVIAGNDAADAAGLTQILAQTGQSLLGMHVDLTRSRKLTAQITRAAGNGQPGKMARLQRQRAKIDDRFNERLALAATVRYLRLAEQRFGRADLAVESYHMGIGNLQHVLDEYDGGHPVPYVQLYFDTAPDHHPTAFNTLSGFGDDSSLYYWRILGAAQIMRLYLTDRRVLERLISLQTSTDSAAAVLHPPDTTRSFANPDALYRAYASKQLLPLPSNARALGLAYSPEMGSLAKSVGASRAAYRGLRTPALDLLVELAARVRALSGGATPLRVDSTVVDGRYLQQLGDSDPAPTTGYTFTIARRYVRPSQAVAFQAMLDRLQALNLIAWERFSGVIEVTVASDAAHAIVDGP